MHSFALGGYLLQITKKRKLLITTKKRIFANPKEKVVELVTLCPWEVQHRFQEVTLKICSKHLLLQFRVREFQQKASLIATQVQCRPDSPWENLSMGLIPMCQHTSHRFSKSGAGLHSPPPCIQVPYNFLHCTLYPQSVLLNPFNMYTLKAIGKTK